MLVVISLPFLGATLLDLKRVAHVLGALHHPNRFVRICGKSIQVEPLTSPGVYIKKSHLQHVSFNILF